MERKIRLLFATTTTYAVGFSSTSVTLRQVVTKTGDVMVRQELSKASIWVGKAGV